MQVKYQGRTVLVTGGARGLGRLIARNFAKRGAKIAVADVRESDLQSCVREMESIGAQCLPIPVDLSTQKACEQMAARTVEQFGKIDFLVNNAGVVWNKDFQNQSEADIKKMINVNLMAQVWTTRAVLPDMARRNAGVIVSISSGMGLVGVPTNAVYCATKFALRGFFDALRHELRKSGSAVSVIVCYPGYMDTKMFSGAKIPRMTKMFDPQKVADSLTRAVEKGREEVVIPKTLYGVALIRALLPPRLSEKALEWTGMHESFYGSKTLD